MWKAFFEQRQLATVYAPIINLSPFEKGPVYLKAPGYALNDLLAGKTSLTIQRQLPYSFRKTLLDDINASFLHCSDPRELPAEWRTRGWDALCDVLSRFESVSTESQIALIGLLNTICFQSKALELFEGSAGKLHLGLSIELLNSKITLALEGLTPFPLDPLLAFVENESTDGILRIRALIPAVVHMAKNEPDNPSLEKLCHKAIAISDDLQCPSEFENLYWRNRLLRATSMLAWTRNEKEKLTTEIHVCLTQARTLYELSSESSQRIKDVAHENLLTVLQTSAKTFSFLGNLELALQLIDEKVNLDKYDSVSYVERAEIRLAKDDDLGALEDYAIGAALGTPVRALASYMAGQILIQRKRFGEALFFNLEALASDPLSTSAWEDVIATSKQLDLPLLEGLAKERLERL